MNERDVTRRSFVSVVAASALPLVPQSADSGAARLTVVCVGGHPDDPESGCGGTLARYAALGHAVTVVYLTRGERGRAGEGGEGGGGWWVGGGGEGGGRGRGGGGAAGGACPAPAPPGGCGPARARGGAGGGRAAARPPPWWAPPPRRGPGVVYF